MSKFKNEANLSLLGEGIQKTFEVNPLPKSKI